MSASRSSLFSWIFDVQKQPKTLNGVSSSCIIFSQFFSSWKLPSILLIFPIWRFPETGLSPKSSTLNHLNWMFPNKNHPAIGVPPFWEPFRRGTWRRPSWLSPHRWPRSGGCSDNWRHWAATRAWRAASRVFEQLQEIHIGEIDGNCIQFPKFEIYSVSQSLKL